MCFCFLWGGGGGVQPGGWGPSRREINLAPPREICGNTSNCVEVNDELSYGNRVSPGKRCRCSARHVPHWEVFTPSSSALAVPPTTQPSLRHRVPRPLRVDNSHLDLATIRLALFLAARPLICELYVNKEKRFREGVSQAWDGQGNYVDERRCSFRFVRAVCCMQGVATSEHGARRSRRGGARRVQRRAAKREGAAGGLSCRGTCTADITYRTRVQCCAVHSHPG